MSVKIITGPAEMPVSLEEARTAAKANGTDSDSEIMIQVAALTAEAEHMIGQVVINRTYETKLASFPAAIESPALPFFQVSEIEYVNPEESILILGTDVYTVDESGDRPQIVLAPGFEWPATAARADAVRVRVICGHGATSASTPAAFKGYILAKIREYFAPPGTPESPNLVRMLDGMKVY